MERPKSDTLMILLTSTLRERERKKERERERETQRVSEKMHLHAVSCGQVSVNKLMQSKILHSFGNL